MLDQLRRAVEEDPLNVEILDRFYRQAVASNVVDGAKTTIAQLQERFPGNHQLRKTHIALCLSQQDYPGAMAGIETLVAFSALDDALIDAALGVRSHLEPRTIGVGPDEGPSISLCMIVKDEQAFLGPCLNAIKKMVHEMIVVDTGSKDRSADLARIYGARVYEFAWCDDFSAARNHSLQKARGDWVLILDADEIIAPQDHDVVKGLVAAASGTPKAYSLQTRNYTNLANAMGWQANDHSYPQQETCLGWFGTRKVRLFPRHPDIRFQYPVHELVDPTIRAAGLPIAQCQVPIHHYGHVNEKRNAHKARYYFELGYEKLEQLGNDRVAIRELAVQAGQLEQWTEAIDLWQRLVDMVPDFSEAYANMAGAHWQLGNYPEGVFLARQAVRTSPRKKEGHYNLAINLLMDGQPGEAARILHELLQEHPRYLAAEFMLAVALSVSGDDSQAQPLFRSLNARMPPQALDLAVREVIQKMAASDLSGHAHKLAHAAGIDPMTNSNRGPTC